MGMSPMPAIFFSNMSRSQGYSVASENIKQGLEKSDTSLPYTASGYSNYIEVKATNITIMYA